MIDRSQHAAELMAFDRQYRQAGLVVAGMDEVGRGPLAGNVVTACVVMPEDPLIIWIDDSKKLSESRREKVFDEIMANALYVGVGEASPEEIDRINILEATRNAMRKAAAEVPADIFLIDAVTKLFGPAISALTPSVGHLLVEAGSDRLFGVFRKIRFMNFWIACFAATSLLVMVQPFVSLWFGPQYLLEVPVIMLLAFQLFQTLMRGSYNAFQDAAGIFYENRFVPLAESALNLISSLILLHVFGLAGVFMGTIISGTALWCFSYPRFVYRKLFERSYGEYASETASYILLFVAVAGSAWFLSGRIAGLVGERPLIQFVADAALCAVYPNAVLALVFGRSDLFRYFIGLVQNRLKRS